MSGFPSTSINCFALSLFMRAAAIGANEYWLCAANSLGVSAGKMLSPQSIAIGTASCGLVGKDGEVLGKIAPYAFGFVIIMALLIQGGVMLGLGM